MMKILAILGIVFLMLIVMMLYACLIASSVAERREEDYLSNRHALAANDALAS